MKGQFSLREENEKEKEIDVYGLDELVYCLNISLVCVILMTQLKREWWALVTVAIVLILKYLYDPTWDTVSIGPQLVKDGSAS